MKVVHVTWVDPAFTRGGWMDRRDFADWLRSGPAVADSVGMLAYEDADCIVLVQSVGEGVVADAVKIIRPAIREVREIGEVPITLDLEGVTTTAAAPPEADKGGGNS